MADNPMTSSLEIEVPLEEDGAFEIEEPLPPLRGLYLQYFSVGLVYGALPGTLYGFFMGYLDVDAHVYATALQVVSLPWSFKFVYGMLNDCLPIHKQHRRPYMSLGWTICALALLALARSETPRQGDSSLAGMFAFKMALASVGYVMADVAADGLVVQYAKMENTNVRGTVQSNVYLVRTVGSIVASLLVGLGMNGKQYSGTFEWTMSFSQICAILAAQSIIMVPVSWVYIEEPVPTRKLKSIRKYFSDCYILLKSRAMFYVVIYSIAHGIMGSISTTAGPNVTKLWAGVHTLQAQLFGVLAMCIFALGLCMVKKCLLDANWRYVIAITTVLLTAIDAIFVYCTIYNVVRNQYFYLGESAIVMVPAAAKFLVTCFVVVEMAPSGMEGMVYGILTTLHNLGGPIGRGISNALYGLAFSGLSEADNYTTDSDGFRDSVAISYGIGYACGIVGLGLLVFLPAQKAQAHCWIRQWPKRVGYARATIALLLFSWVFAISSNMLAMFPSTSCMRIVGGSGC